MGLRSRGNRIAERRKSETAGQSVDVLLFKGQYIDLGTEHREGANASEEVNDGDASTLFVSD